LGNIAAILKAYPNAHVKIGGYTDNTGEAAANVALSSARAKNVMDALVGAGIDSSRLESKGYGDQYPVGDNATEEGRAQNRRIALLVTQK
jgi:OmpA-OmpF porin, OOP family